MSYERWHDAFYWDGASPSVRGCNSQQELDEALKHNRVARDELRDGDKTVVVSTVFNPHGFYGGECRGLMAFESAVFVNDEIVLLRRAGYPDEAKRNHVDLVSEYFTVAEQEAANGVE